MNANFPGCSGTQRGDASIRQHVLEKSLRSLFPRWPQAADFKKKPTIAKNGEVLAGNGF